MLDNHTFGFEQTHSKRGLHAWFHRDRPAILAAAWVWVFFAVLAFISLFTGWASLAFTLTLQFVVCLFAGMLAARIERHQHTDEPNFKRMGTFAGFYLCLASAMLLFFVAVVLGIGSLGIIIPLMIPYFLSLPVQLGGCGISGWIGASIYRWLFVRG